MADILLKPTPCAAGRPARAGSRARSPSSLPPAHARPPSSPTSSLRSLWRATGHRASLPLPPLRGILDSYRAASASTEAGEDDDGDGHDADVCPVECVAAVAGVEGFDAALREAGPSTLVVVDFYKTSCGACRYIAPGFVKLCKAAGSTTSTAPDVAFMKHNVDDDDGDGGRSELAVREGVRAVPTFHFYRGGQRLEAFPTRDKAAIAAAVNRLVGRDVL
jgi:thiol-disulfide isomerase/thioredoxin